MTVGDTILCLNFLRTGHVNNFSIRVQEVHTAFVFSIICRPYDVTLDEIARQGSFPIVAPVKPYTEFALICKMDEKKGSDQIGKPTLRASWRPSNTARLEGSLSFFKSAFARFRALIKSSNIVGRRPFRRDGFTNQSSKRP
jgi:hypothetical protein